jgi:Holliday junction resolvase RusA-like endonuclease
MEPITKCTRCDATWTLSVEGVPIAKPRQTRRDKWMQRDSVMRYRNYADHLRLAANCQRLASLLPQIRKVELLFVIPIPPSYSKRRRAETIGQPCEAKPDLDNLCKSVLDALWPAGDSAITQIAMRKIWDDGAGARTEIVFKLEAA